MEEKELKREFELERVILFSDAVFAIIITIMVLEIKLPEGLRHASHDKSIEAFVDLAPRFGAYVLSFFLVSAFWLRHLKIFRVLKDYDIPLVVRNLIFLFVISLFPFAVTIISGTISPHSLWALDVYIGIIMAGIFAQTLIIQYIVKHRQKLCFSPSAVEDTLKWKAHRLNFILTPIAVIAAVVVNLLGLVQLVVYVILIQMLIVRASAKRFYPKSEKL